MKNRYLVLLFLSFMIVSFTFGQTNQLTFRFANVRTMRYSGTDYFEFDIQVESNTSGTYIWSGQAVMTFDNTTLSTNSSSWGLTAGTLLSGNNSRFGNHPKYPTLTANINGTAPNKTVIIAWGGDPAVEGNGPNANDFNLMPTSYQTLVTVDAPITSSTGVAGMGYIQSQMNGQQFYISAPSTFTAYYNPNLYVPHNFVRTYVGRIYSNTYGWSQVGNSSNTQWVNWATAVNTSVWDTVGGAAAQISSSVTNGLANALRIDTVAALNINAGAALTCSGATEISAPHGLIISAGSTSLGQFIDNGTITYNNGATVQVQCYYVYDEWHYYTIPLTSTIALPYYYKYMKYFQEPTSHWKYVVAVDSILNTSMLGYAMWASSTGTFATSNYVMPSGVLNTGAKSITLTNTPGSTNDGWNLVGNPYPSAIDLTSSGVTWGSTFTTLYFWNPNSGGNYVTYLRGGGGTHDQYVPPQQGFYIYSNVASTTFGLNNTARLINSESFLKDVIPDRLLLTATSSNNGYYDESVIRFTNEATNYFDPGYDAFKLYGNFDAPQLYSIGNADTVLSVNALNWTNNSMVVPMGFSCGVNGNYSILASNMQTFPSSITIYLKDLKTNTLQNLLDNPLYNFSYATTDDPNRFQIQFTAPSSVIDNNNISNLQIYSYEDFVYVKNLVKGTTKGIIQIYDMLGRKVFNAMLQDTELNKFVVDVNEGYYMVNVITDDNSYTQKVYLK
jgi:hypothetical protein